MWKIDFHSLRKIGGLQSLSSYQKSPTQNHNLLHVARKNGGTVQEIVQQLEINPPRPGELIDSLLWFFIKKIRIMNILQRFFIFSQTQNFRNFEWFFKFFEILSVFWIFKFLAWKWKMSVFHNLNVIWYFWIIFELFKINSLKRCVTNPNSPIKYDQPRIATLGTNTCFMCRRVRRFCPRL